MSHGQYLPKTFFVKLALLPSEFVTTVAAYNDLLQKKIKLTNDVSLGICKHYQRHKPFGLYIYIYILNLGLYINIDIKKKTPPTSKPSHSIW